MGNLLIQNYILSSGCNWFRSSYVVWKWMFNNYYGIFNYLGTKTGIIDQNINWLGDERYALACIILILLTTSVGQPIVLYVSALGNVDASWWKRQM